MSREPMLFLRDMVESALKAISYAKGMSQEEFEAHGMAYDSVLRNLEIIGEAAKQVPGEKP